MHRDLAGLDVDEAGAAPQGAQRVHPRRLDARARAVVCRTRPALPAAQRMETHVGPAASWRAARTSAGIRRRRGGSTCP
jgi:hypothetical protein